MPRPTNAEIAETFLDHLRAKGFDIFTEDHEHGVNVHRSLFVTLKGQSGIATSNTLFREQVRLWLVDEGIVKTDKQLTNIVNAIRCNTEHRGPNLKYPNI